MLTQSMKIWYELIIFKDTYTPEKRTEFLRTKRHCNETFLSQESRNPLFDAVSTVVNLRFPNKVETFRISE
jgi:hypothetical protein